jgi:hypothetical protein
MAPNSRHLIQTKAHAEVINQSSVNTPTGDDQMTLTDVKFGRDARKRLLNPANDGQRVWDRDRAPRLGAADA